jgi:LPS O-antigen subunit length determinant protein (WzzB/FepE family)
MNTRQKIPLSIDDEISLLDIINFFQSHKRFILALTALGAILGAIFAEISGPVYIGDALISPAKVAGNFIDSPSTLVTKLKINSFYSKKSFLNCKPDFYNSSNDDDDYNISAIVKSSPTTDGQFIKLSMDHKDKTAIQSCLNSIIDDIQKEQNKSVGATVEILKNQLKREEDRLKILTGFEKKLIYQTNKKLKKNGLQDYLDIVLINIISNNESNINEAMNQINKINLSIEEIQQFNEILPLDIKKASFPSLKFGLILGLSFGLGLGLIISIFKQTKH